MKTRRIVSSVAVAAAIVLGATGCGLMAPQGTTEPYAPSDGIEFNLPGADVRNLMLIADESGENFNVVFTGVNTTDAPVLLRMVFVGVGGTSEATADFELAPGTTVFGNPEGDIAPTLVSIPKLEAGATVEAYFEVAGGGEVNRQVPVLDGTLAEYRAYVLSPSQVRSIEKEADAQANQDGTGNAAEADAAEGTNAE